MTNATDDVQSTDWTFLSNHSHVLYCISIWPDIRIRDIAAKVRITERAVQRIVVDLEQGGYLKRQRVGRQNHYRLEPRRHLRHPLEHHVQVGRLLGLLQPGAPSRASAPRNVRDTVVVTARGLGAARARAGAKTLARLKKKPKAVRKLVAKK